MKRNSLALVIIAILLSSLNLYSQKNFISHVLKPGNVGQGKVLIDNESVLEGEVTYNVNDGFVKIQNNDDNRSFTPRGIIGFEFFDCELGRKRVFHTLLDGNNNPLFYEMLQEFDNFAVLSTTTPFNVEESRGRYGSKSIDAVQTETIYFLSSEGEFIPYIRFSNYISQGVLSPSHRSRKKVLGTSLLGEYFPGQARALLREYFPEPGYTKMMRFAKQNKLSVKVKEDLNKILAYYKATVQ